MEKEKVREEYELLNQRLKFEREKERLILEIVIHEMGSPWTEPSHKEEIHKWNAIANSQINLCNDIEKEIAKKLNYLMIHGGL